MGRPVGLWQWWLGGVAVGLAGSPLGLFLGCRPGLLRGLRVPSGVPTTGRPVSGCGWRSLGGCVEGVPRCDGYFHSGGVEVLVGSVAEELIKVEERHWVFGALQWWRHC